MVTLHSLVQTFLSLVVLGALSLLASALLVAAVLAYASASRHPLHGELCAYLRRAGKGTGLLHRLGLVLLVGGPRAVFLYRLSCMLRPLRMAPLLFLLRQLNRWLNMCEISPYAELGPGLQIFHATSIIVPAGVRAGRDLWLFQDVILGSNWGKMPILGDGVIVFCGARVFGGIRVGDGCVLSNNVVVLRDVPDGSVVRLGDTTVVKPRDPGAAVALEGMVGP